mgnify:FL=1
MTVVDLWLTPAPAGIESLKELSAEELLIMAMELNHDVTLDDNRELKGDRKSVV